MKILKNIKEFINDFRKFQDIQRKQREQYMMWIHSHSNIPICSCAIAKIDKD